jgi:hypothetical protein
MSQPDLPCPVTLDTVLLITPAGIPFRDWNDSDGRLKNVDMRDEDLINLSVESL